MSTSYVIAASAVIIDQHTGCVLLIRRGHEPAKGLWSLPGGGVEATETPAQAVVREVAEETGLVVEVGSELWSVTVPLAPGRDYLIHGFRATITGGVLTPGDDAEDAAWVSPDEFSSLSTTPRLAELLRSAGWPVSH